MKFLLFIFSLSILTSVSYAREKDCGVIKNVSVSSIKEENSYNYEFVAITWEDKNQEKFRISRPTSSTVTSIMTAKLQKVNVCITNSRDTTIVEF